VESNVNVWLDSSVNNYIFRPALTNSIVDGICLWEYESKYDLQLKKAHFLQESNDVDGHQGCIFQFHDQHPGYQYSILQQREDECIPQLYYSNKFPDIEVLEIEQGDNVDESVKQLREDYALKAMLLFFPFREKEDLTRNYSSLWESFLFEKKRWITSIECNMPLESPHLYKSSPVILQNIQDLLNIRKYQIALKCRKCVQ